MNRTFDITRLPTSWDDIRNGTAFRGAGQRFRLEAAPGTELQRYTATFQEPYLFDTRVGLSTSASYFTRYFYDWAEGRVGGPCWSWVSVRLCPGFLSQYWLPW